ncbi:type IX secretion system membrane protein PorP/SprF, partial [Arthrospira platensis SPKY1]|nr:type IX secretion system membrane protein PorP/SprF [Arthrospira platensis SPKY1]
MSNIYLTLMLGMMWASLLQGQQLPYRSSFAAADFIWNPAMTAPSEYLDWGISYRQQWLGFEQAPFTAVAHLQ